MAPANPIQGKRRATEQYHVRRTLASNSEWTSRKLAFAANPILAAASPRTRDCSSAYATAWQNYRANHDLNAYLRSVAEHYATDPDYTSNIMQLSRCSY